MPERARETGIDEGVRNVRLFCESRQKLWLCTTDADWALKYLSEQLLYRGVRRVAPDDVGPGGLPEATRATSCHWATGAQKNKKMVCDTA